MINTFPHLQTNLFGLFELDETGTILYSRIAPDGTTCGIKPSLVGHQFFDEITPFQNLAELRSRFSAFLKSSDSSDNFNFTCEFAERVQPVKVMLVKISESSFNKQTRSVIVEIRPL